MIVIDPEFESLIPENTPDALCLLEEDLKKHGCREPLVVWKGILLDGHHRKAICDRHGIHYDIVELDLPNREAAKLWVIENQLGRRNLSERERTMLAAERVLLLTGALQAAQADSPRDGKGRKASSGAPRGRTRDMAARDLSISPRSIQSAITILRGGAPELVTEAKAGRLAISAAAGIASLPREEQQSLLAAGKKALIARAKEIRAKRSNRSLQSPAVEVTSDVATKPETFELTVAQERVRRWLEEEEGRWPDRFKEELETLLYEIARDVTPIPDPPDVPLFTLTCDPPGEIAG